MHLEGKCIKIEVHDAQFFAHPFDHGDKDHVGAWQIGLGRVVLLPDFASFRERQFIAGETDGFAFVLFRIL